ncbi:MAG: hypothetical protein PHW95_05065 [Patescibacteria group bacterium]|nr:hypothetical protein [Patescibacteria group bacterium]
MLDVDKLPVERAVYKACWCCGFSGMNFGSLYVKSRTDPCDRNVLEGYFPEIAEMVTEGSKQLALPDGWRVKTIWYGDDCNAAVYVSVSFLLPWEIGFLKRGDRVPLEVAYLLSGYFQLGESLTFRNFRNYRALSNLKFLPFLITRSGFQVHVYHPTPERVEAVIPRLAELQVFCDKLQPQLSSLLNDVYALVRLDEVSAASTLIRPAYEAIETRITDTIGKRKAGLGYLFRDLTGSQNARPFSYGMFSKTRV